ncbi:hypothetical protein BACIH_0062 [Bacillus amyloliquefaciens]|nr:hypothetical protein U471_00890 [Bacillus amyloliquefaciens CC178]QEY91864.1 hypothetical protein BACIH_0062 [Bacillus amyloliquefaciens]RAP05720.1 hypothetical protein HS9_01666 [Bacillus velezensis]
MSCLVFKDHFVFRSSDFIIISYQSLEVNNFLNFFFRQRLV